MKSNLFKSAQLLLIVALAGCAGAKTEDQTQSASLYGTRPSQVVLYPFAVNPDEVTLNQSIFQRAYRNVSATNVGAEQNQLAEDTAQKVCIQAVTTLNQKGYNAICQNRGVPPPAGNVFVVDGEFTDISEGNRLRRMVIGFGVGASTLDTNVYVYQPAPDGGQHQVLSFNTHADSGKMPGVAVTGPAGAAAGGATAAATLGVNVAASGVKGVTSSTGFLADKTAQQIVDAIQKYYVQQGWSP